MHAIDELAAHTEDGVTLRLDRVSPAGARNGAVLCLHAMMTDGRYFGARRSPSFVHSLVDAGLEAYVADFRGHGRSVPPRAGRDDWSFDDLVERDLPALIAYVAATSGCPPSEIAIVGHSLGGLVATAAIATARVPSPRVLMLAATTVWLRGSVARRTIMAGYRRITGLFGKAPVRLLRVGTADEAASYVRQLTDWSSSGRWTSLSGIDYSDAQPMIDVPIAPIVGANDRMCTVDDAARFARRFRRTEPIRVVGRGSGDAFDPGHFDLFTAPELAPVWHELAARLAN